MSKLGRIAYALENIENQLLALNEWLARYGETRLEPPLPSPGIHLVKLRALTGAEKRYGRRLAAEKTRAEILETLIMCRPMFRQVTCAGIPGVGPLGWIIEVDEVAEGIGHMRVTPDGRARQFVAATVCRLDMDDESNDRGWITLRRFSDGKLFDCELIVTGEEEEPAGGRRSGGEGG